MATSSREQATEAIIREHCERAAMDLDSAALREYGPSAIIDTAGASLFDAGFEGYDEALERLAPEYLI